MQGPGNTNVLFSVYGCCKTKKAIELNRKVLADLAMNHPEAFQERG